MKLFKCIIIYIFFINIYSTALYLNKNSKSKPEICKQVPKPETKKDGPVFSINPVSKIIGNTLALTYFYKQLKEQNIENGGLQSKLTTDQEIQFDNMESTYYLERKNALLSLKEKFIAIKVGLENSYKLDHKQMTILNQDLLNDPLFFKKKHMDIYLSQKKKINEQERTITRKKREAQLLQIETDIIELQAALVFDFNQLIESVDSACQECDKQNNKNTLNSKQNDKIEGINNYKKTFSELSLFEKAEAQILALKMVIKYYKTQKNTSVIKETTNIPGIIEILEKELPKKEGFLKIKKDSFLKKKLAEELSLLMHNVNLKLLQHNICKKLKEEAEESESKELIAIKDTYKKTPKHDAVLLNKNNNNSHLVTLEPKTKDKNTEEQRKKNDLLKIVFFKNPLIKKNYEHYKQNVYRLKSKSKEIEQNMFYLKWDNQNSNIEVWNKEKKYLGIIDPRTLKFNIEPADPNRKPF